MNNLNDSLDRMELHYICQGLKNNNYLCVDEIVDFDLLSGSFGTEAKYSLLDKSGQKSTVLFWRNKKGYPMAEESR
tara:strand:+ start:298 stop:525 length:228 start_codon:yes stop_codon:yes gene_type:complete